MTQPSPARPNPGHWLLLLALALWLAFLPLVVMGLLSALNSSPPDLLTQLELVPPSQPILPEWALGLFAILLSLGLNLLVFVPLLFASRRPGREFLHTATTLLVAIALFQALAALARLLVLVLPQADPAPPGGSRVLAAGLSLALALPFLLLVLGRLEARRQNCSLVSAWGRVGLRRWFNPSSLGLALGAGAVVVGPWVLVGSLGSSGTTAATLLQALSNALNEEILFRGFAFAWLWRVARSRTAAAAGSLVLFVAAQGATVLPAGDWTALLRFASALLLGLLATELTVRARGSIWPAVAVHFLYDWFHFAFVDPRSTEEILHWLAQIWAPLAAGGLGLLFWLGRKVVTAAKGGRIPRRSLGGLIAASGFAVLSWAAVLILYLTAGVPGFHPDGFLIILKEQADLGPAADIADPGERRAWVYRTLVDTADNSQVSLRAELDRRGVPYRAHYLVNAIEVLDRPGLRRAFARRPEVSAVPFQPGMRRYAYPFKVPVMDPGGPQGVEWNVLQVGADRVWELGYTGQGVIVGDADTGVAWDHPALKGSYLGWDGHSADHDYHWYDPWDDRPEPWDDNGHGTHTTGTMVGLDGENAVGLAPGARWIACRNMRHGVGNPGGYLSCMEFLLAPFPSGGDPLHTGDPARGAHVVNNSWGCPGQEGCLPGTLRAAVDNLRASGQMMVVSAGNDGPACNTVQDPPAIYDAVFTVGATGWDDQAASFSSRGPVAIDGSQRPKPDLVAPGVNVRSSVPGGYASLPGTSMAGPHVAGAVALLWSVEQSLIGDLDGTQAILRETAQRLTVEAVCAEGTRDLDTVCACGGDGLGSVPNNVYGWGRVDVWAAVQKLLDGQ